MNKRLPNLYVNKIEKKINNNNTIFYSANKYNIEIVKEEQVDISTTDFDGSVIDKIKELFNSPNFVYKINTTIFLKDGTKLKKEVIGQMDSKLITIDDDAIDINDIVDIKF